MNRSNEPADNLQEVPPALQHERGPRPLPLFLDLVRRLSRDRPALARDALAGLARYQGAERDAGRPPRPVVAREGPARLLDGGGNGPPALLIPSLINPPAVLDLDEQVSLLDSVTAMGRRAMLVDWGPAAQRASLDVGGHVEQLLMPLLRSLDRPPALVGYCLGGTMALAAAALSEVERVATLASPWHFSAYPAASRDDLHALWDAGGPASARLGAMPMELLQAAFWSLDPARTVAKFAAFAAFPDGSDEARRFVALEDWANEGEPLPLPAARELIDDLFGRDMSGSGAWTIGGRTVAECPSVPALHLTARDDRIAPAASAPRGERRAIAGGHVGMVIGRAREPMLAALDPFLRPACRQ